MDAKLRWKISSDVDSLVAVIAACRKELVTVCTLKHGMKTKFLTCDAFAGDKLIELFQTSDKWVSASESGVIDETVPLWRQQQKSTQLVADFTAFKLHKMSVLGETDVRVIVAFDVGDMAEQIYFGNIEVTP